MLGKDFFPARVGRLDCSGHVGKIGLTCSLLDKIDEKIRAVKARELRVDGSLSVYSNGMGFTVERSENSDDMLCKLPGNVLNCSN